MALSPTPRGPVLGVDLGGTKIFAALNSSPESTGPFLAQARSDTEGGSSRDRILENLYRTIDTVLEGAGLSAGDRGGLGVCVPGIVRPDQGLVVDCTNLAGWQEVRLGALLETRYGVPVKIDNDARAACWAASFLPPPSPFPTCSSRRCTDTINRCSWDGPVTASILYRGTAPKRAWVSSWSAACNPCR